MEEEVKPIRLKLVSDGTNDGTKLIDIVTGREVEGLCLAYTDVDKDQNTVVTGSFVIELFGVEIAARVAASDDPTLQPLNVEVQAIPDTSREPVTAIDFTVRGAFSDAETFQDMDNVTALKFEAPGPELAGVASGGDTFPPAVTLTFIEQAQLFAEPDMEEPSDGSRGEPYVTPEFID